MNQPAIRILVVDDEASIRRALRPPLVELGFQFAEASRGEEALQLLHSGTFDAVLLDINMPGIGGIETLRRIRAFAPRLPVLMVTVREGEEEKVEALELGADDYITKPFSTRELIARIRTAVRRVHAPARAEDAPIEIGEIRLTPGRRGVTKRGQAVHLTRTNSALGTPLYMSPEQARSPRDVDHRTDLYSVGAILYEMLSGRTPYTADSGEFTEILFKIFTTEPEPLATLRPDLPDGLAALVHRALSRERDARFASANDMAEALAPYADERSYQVLARLRTGRRSQTPARSSTVTPVVEAVRATQAEAMARTHASDGAALRPASTSVGVTRESNAADAQPRARSTGVVVAIAAVVVAAVAGTGFLLLHGSSPAPGIEKSAVEPPPLPAPSAVVLPPPAIPAAPTAIVLAPESTEQPAPSSLPSAHPGPARPSPRASASAGATPIAPTSPALPSQLGDLKLH